jgi:hypothetical protein
MDLVFGTGRVCSGSTHYLFESEDGAPIPADACPINCVINDFLICGQGGEGSFPREEGNHPGAMRHPSKEGNCVRFTIRYQIRVW